MQQTRLLLIHATSLAWSTPNSEYSSVRTLAIPFLQLPTKKYSYSLNVKNDAVGFVHILQYFLPGSSGHLFHGAGRALPVGNGAGYSSVRKTNKRRPKIVYPVHQLLALTLNGAIDGGYDAKGDVDKNEGLAPLDSVGERMSSSVTSNSVLSTRSSSNDED